VNILLYNHCTNNAFCNPLQITTQSQITATKLTVLSRRVSALNAATTCFPWRIYHFLSWLDLIGQSSPVWFHSGKKSLISHGDQTFMWHRNDNFLFISNYWLNIWATQNCQKFIYAVNAVSRTFP